MAALAFCLSLEQLEVEVLLLIDRGYEAESGHALLLLDPILDDRDQCRRDDRPKWIAMVIWASCAQILMKASERITQSSVAE